MARDGAPAGAENPNLAAALYHVRAGRPVFPCSPRNKRPAIPKDAGGNGFKDATTDESQVRRWWAQYPDAVPGMPTGARVGVWVLDVDSKAGKVGRDTLHQLAQTFGPLPETVETITATGGSHLFFRHPRDGRTIPNSASQLGLGHETWGTGGYPAVPFERLASGRLRVPDLDVRGDGGYVILPGAVMADGRRYEWEGSSDPDEGAKVAEAPAWLLALVAHDPSTADERPAGPSGALAAIGEGGRNDCLYRLGCSLRAKGLGAAAIEAALLAENAERCDPPLPADEVRATARSAASKPPGLSPRYAERAASARGEAQSGRRPPGGKPDLRVVGGSDSQPLVRITNGKLHEAVDDTEAYLIAGGAHLYQHGTRLVRVGAWDAGQGPVQRPVGAGVLVDISPEWLADAASRRIRFERFDKRADDWRPVDCPSKVATTLLSRVGSWRFPTLAGFVDSPTLDLAGRVVHLQGYDPESGLYLSRPPEIAPIGVMGRHDAEGAGDCLYEAVSTFPFVTEADRSACLALILTALLRRVLPAAPIGGISASTPGTGKSKLAHVISAIATGRSASVVALGTSPEELEKRLDSVLLEGDAICCFDNVDRAVKSDVLCQVATEERKSIRVMGLSKIVKAPTNVCLLMTGNNLTLVGDLVRRVVVANLDAGCERPERRVFARDAVGYVLERRAELIRAALVVSKAYLDCGCPEVDAVPFGSFESWDRMVRKPLMWIGWPDPLAPAESMREADHELAGMRDLLTAWLAVRGEPCTAAELAELARERLDMGMGDWRPRYPELHEAAVQVMGEPTKWGARELGYRLRAMQGRLFGGLRIVKVSAGKHAARWAVESLRAQGGE